jgi:hypothetical protein
MRNKLGSLGMATLLLALLTLAPQARAGEAEAKAFERIKALAGTWVGKTPEGKPTTLKIQVIAGGHTVMEEYSESGHNGMFTMYHLDGDHLMLTHYCVSNNQPRMRAVLNPAEPDTIRFKFLDGTNLQDPNAGHMVEAAYFFKDANHMSNLWSYRMNQQPAFARETAWERQP